MIYILLLAICALLWLIAVLMQSDWISFAAFALTICTLCSSCTNSDWYKKGEVDRRRAEALEAQPHVIREVDGCKVYTFKTDRWMYFTRCGANTTTESSYTESCGENCTKTEVDVIVTENK